MSSQKAVFYKRAVLMSVMLAGCALLCAGEGPADKRQLIALHDLPWQFYGAGASDAMPEPGTPASEKLVWSTLSLPHVFQTRAARVYVMCTKAEKAPSFLAAAGVTEVPGTQLVWRDNDVMLVSAQLFMHSAAAGETIRLEQADRDAVVLLKE